MTNECASFAGEFFIVYFPNIYPEWTILSRKSSIPALVQAIAHENFLSPPVKDPHIEFGNLCSVSIKNRVDLILVRRKCIRHIQASFYKNINGIIKSTSVCIY